jgi:hypothetical protein
MHGFHLLVTMVVGGTIRDTQCGFKASQQQQQQGIRAARRASSQPAGWEQLQEI